MTRTVQIVALDEIRRLRKCPTCLLMPAPACGCTIVPLTDQELAGLPLKARLALMDATTKFLARTQHPA